MTDAEATQLRRYVAAWRCCADDLLALLADMSPDDWSRPTDCPGWTVRDVVAHLAAIEHELATGKRPVDVPPGAREVVSQYTQAGVDARRDASPEQLRAELAEAVRRRADQLAALRPDDPAGSPDRTPGGIEWDWGTLLRNRVIDLWVHEQDIRRAIGRDGGMQTPAADVVAAVFGAAMGYVIGKRAGARPGTVARVHVDDVATTYAVDDTGRCRPTREEFVPDAVLRMDRATFTTLAAGRRRADELPVEVEGDAELAARILASMAITP